MDLQTRQIFDCVETGLLILDSGERICSWNRWMSMASGISAESARGKTLGEVFSEFDSARVQRAVEGALERGTSTMLSRALGGSPFPLEASGRSREHFKRMQHTVTVTPLNHEGGRQCIIQITDVTGASVRELSLRAETNKVKRLASIVESTAEAVFSTDVKGNIVTWNEAATELFQYSADEILGQSIEKMIPQGRLDEHRELMSRLATGTSAVAMETVRAAKDGSLLEVKVSKSAYLDEVGRFAGVSSIIRDIRMEKKLHAELQRAKSEAEMANAAKSQFLANMSHEIRTPMNGVMGMTELLLGTDLTEEQSEFAATIHSSAFFLMEVINDLLDFSKIEADCLEVESIQFVPAEVVSRTLALFSSNAEKAGLHLRVDLDDDLSSPAVGDPHRIQQILNNLVGNAIKFTKAGEVVIRGRGEKKSGSEIVLYFEVEDTGIGVSEEARRHIFMPFTQADGSTTRNYGGTGLGLSICSSLAYLMGGDIGMRSSSREGSTFWFNVTCGRPTQIIRPPESVDEVVAMGAESGVEPATPRGHVLVVEDNRVNQKVAKAMLEKLNLVVDLAANGREGLQAMSTHDYDIVFMDCQMPVLGGIDATLEARRLETEGHVPIIAMTAQASSDNRSECLEAGMDDFVSKPISLRVLAEVLDRWIPGESDGRSD